MSRAQTSASARFCGRDFSPGELERIRDRLIGWSSTQRQRNLHLVLNNDRFLLLPWVRCPNLASRVLGLVCRRLAADWFSRYGYRPVLLETFVQLPRFTGTAYRAANWRYVGLTKGRGKLEKLHQVILPQKPSSFIHYLKPDAGLAFLRSGIEGRG
jgi:hypothetical protein